MNNTLGYSGADQQVRCWLALASGGPANADAPTTSATNASTNANANANANANEARQRPAAATHHYGTRARELDARTQIRTQPLGSRANHLKEPRLPERNLDDRLRAPVGHQQPDVSKDQQLAQTQARARARSLACSARPQPPDSSPAPAPGPAARHSRTGQAAAKISSPSQASYASSLSAHLSPSPPPPTPTPDAQLPQPSPAQRAPQPTARRPDLLSGRRHSSDLSPDLASDLNNSSSSSLPPATGLALDVASGSALHDQAPTAPTSCQLQNLPTQRVQAQQDNDDNDHDHQTKKLTDENIKPTTNQIGKSVDQKLDKQQDLFSRYLAAEEQHQERQDQTELDNEIRANNENNNYYCPNIRRAQFEPAEMEIVHRKQIIQQVQPSLALQQAQQQTSLLLSAQNYQIDRSYLMPKTLPNNTLLEDLSKCHSNLTNLCPRATRATSTTLSLFKSCWPPLIKCDKTKDQPKSEAQLKVSTTTIMPNTIRRANRRKINFHMPDSILRVNSALNADDYDRALCVLTGDVRFKLHILLYRRVQTIWTLFSTILCILIPVLLTNLESLVLVGACLGWLSLQLLGIILTTQFRKKLDQMLEKSVAQVNSFFMDHNMMLGVINVGSMLSKARLLVPMLYFDTSQCREQIESIISIDSRLDADDKNDKRALDYSKIGLPLAELNVMAFAQSQLAKKIVLRYSQRWISHFDKRKLMFTDDGIKPRHLSTGKCLCQFIEEHFKNTNEPFDKKQQQQQDNQATAITIITTNSHLDTKVTAISENETKETTEIGRQDEQQQQESPIEAQVLRNEMQAVPTLSHIVSMKEQTDSFKIHMDQVQTSNSNSGQGQIVNEFAAHLSQQKQQNLTLDRANSTSPLTDVSLDLDGDLLNNDDLIKKLRFLLELRKNQFNGMDGAFYKQQYSTSFVYNNKQKSINGNILSDQTMTGDGHQQNGDVTTPTTIKTSSGKKFFNQSEGLFFFSTKKNQQVNMKQILEIC